MTSIVAANRARSSSLNPRLGEYIKARAPRCTLPVLTPTRSSSPSTTSLPPATPIDPVKVAGKATITSAGDAM